MGLESRLTPENIVEEMTPLFEGFYKPFYEEDIAQKAAEAAAQRLGHELNLLDVAGTTLMNFWQRIAELGSHKTVQEPTQLSCKLSYNYQCYFGTETPSPEHPVHNSFYYAFYDALITGFRQHKITQTPTYQELMAGIVPLYERVFDDCEAAQTMAQQVITEQGLFSAIRSHIISAIPSHKQQILDQVCTSLAFYMQPGLLYGMEGIQGYVRYEELAAK